MRRFYLSVCLLFSIFQLSAQTYVRVEAQDTVTSLQLTLSLFGLVPTPNDVANFKVTYNTTDVFGEPTVASGLLTLPLSGSVDYPLGLYNHGTVTNREAVPSRTTTQERSLPMAFASNGFIVVAPDYLGLGDNPGIHPYVHAESEASAGRDLLLAARQWLNEQGIGYVDQLFLTGYSQGGHATQALHRDLQTNPGTDSLEVTAATHLSGPYSISDVMRETLFAEDLGTLPGYVVFTYISYDYVYDLYDDFSALFQPEYVPLMDSIVNGTISAGDFNDRITDELNRNDLVMADLFQDSIRTQLETKDTTAPIIRALLDNDTYDWAPEAPTRIVYCTADEQVPFRNALLADSVMAANGSTAVTLVNGGATNHFFCLTPAMQETLTLFQSLAEPVSVRHTGEAFSLQLSPNPARAGDRLLLSELPAGRYAYTLHAMSGRQLQAGNVNDDGAIRLPPTLATGVHFLRVRAADGGVVVRRILIK